MANTRIITEKFKNDIMNHIIDDINNQNDIIDRAYYAFVGDSLPYANGDTLIPVPSDDNDDSVINIYQNMIFGKKLYANNCSVMVPRYNWTANTVYSIYSDSDPNLLSEQFYVVVNSGSIYSIFKCLYNNNGNPSLIEPVAADVNPSDFLFETSDGYVWQFMYSMEEEQFENFATPYFMPVVVDANVAANAVAGAIDIIIPITSNNIFYAGSGYNNYYEGQFNASGIQVGGDSLLYAIGDDASSVNNFYNSCLLYISDGTGKGQYSVISQYRVIGLIKEIRLSSAFVITPDATSAYQIYPGVQINGDDNVTENAVAMALVNAFASNGIYNVTVLNRGAGYRIATANVLYNPVVSVTNNAILQVIIPPAGGHGADVYNELGASVLGISFDFANNENGTIPINNDYRTIGLLKNPWFANVAVNITDSNFNAGSNGQFIIGEEVVQLSIVQIQGVSAVLISNNIITGDGNSNFTDLFSVGDQIYINGGPQSFYGIVADISSNIQIVLSSNALFTNSTSLVYVILEQFNSGIIASKTTSSINLTNFEGEINTANNIFLIGNTSFSKAYVNNYMITSISKDFKTFVQLRRYTGILTGNFIPDEVVYQLNISNANGYFHSVNTASNGQVSLFITNQIGDFNVQAEFSGAAPIIGNSSGAQFVVSGAYDGDLVLDSGKVLYYENNPAVSRANTQTENRVIVFQFANN